MPNQWAKIIKPAKSGYAENVGKHVCLELGPPEEKHSIYPDGSIEAALSYAIRHHGETKNQPETHGLDTKRMEDVIEAHRVELLGPDECARLDALYGLKESRAGDPDQ